VTPFSSLLNNVQTFSIWDDDDDSDTLSFAPKKTSTTPTTVKENLSSTKENEAKALSSNLQTQPDSNTTTSVSEKIYLFNSSTEQKVSKTFEGSEKVQSNTSSSTQSNKLVDKILLFEEQKQQPTTTTSITTSKTSDTNISEKISIFDKKEDSSSSPTSVKEVVESSTTKPLSVHFNYIE
jgi:hypothetical protein